MRIELTTAIQAHGEARNYIEFRDPNGGDVAACGFPFNFTTSDEGMTTVAPNAPAISAMISRLGNIPKSSVSQLSLGDWTACMNAVFGFFGQAVPATTPSTAVSTSPGSGNGSLASRSP